MEQRKEYPHFLDSGGGISPGAVLSSQWQMHTWKSWALPGSSRSGMAWSRAEWHRWRELSGLCRQCGGERRQEPAASDCRRAGGWHRWCRVVLSSRSAAVRLAVWSVRSRALGCADNMVAWNLSSI